LYCNSVKSCNSNKILAAKERKEHKEKNLCCFFFAIFVFFCGQFFFGCGSVALGSFAANSTLVAAMSRYALAPLRLSSVCLPRQDLRRNV
jgi:hypothetical protein